MTILDSPPQTATSRSPTCFRGWGIFRRRAFRLYPFPGTATEKDVTAIADRENVTCELVEGTLVEKPMGLRESLLAMLLAHYLSTFIEANNLGFLSGEAGTMNLFGDLIRARIWRSSLSSAYPAKKSATKPSRASRPDLPLKY